MLKLFFTFVLFVSLFISGAYVGKFHANNHLENTLQFINERITPPAMGE
jgi:hypothetical protein